MAKASHDGSPLAPGKKVRLRDADARGDRHHPDKQAALAEIDRLRERMDELQMRLYAEQKRSLLIVLQGMDAAGKDGSIRHVFSGMNPQGCRVAAFKQPSAEEAAHDFLWRIEAQTPKRGEIVVFNRSHYEDVLIVRVHQLVPKKVWAQRYDQINAFEERLADNGTRIIKCFLHLSRAEQLERFKQRLDDPQRNWKISEADYAEREHWDDYIRAYEDALERCGTAAAPWHVIPADRKWLRNLLISRIIVRNLEELRIAVPAPTVDLAAIRKKYHRAAVEG